MKKGIILIFGKNDVDISGKLFFNTYFSEEIKICLVNNGNHDKVFKHLNELKSLSKCDISILNLKKEKTAMLAVKAGVRFLSNSEELNLIVYTNQYTILTENIINKIIKTSNENLINKTDERVLLRRVYSVNEIINC